MSWVPVCAVDDLTPNRGAAALVGGIQLAVFLVEPGAEVLAVGNVDPISGAAVLSRGLVGSADDVLTVASPVYKQRFDLHSGRCLDDESATITTYATRVVDGRVEVEVG